MISLICKLSLLLTLTALCTAPDVFAERFFNHYMGQSEAYLLAEEGPPDETGAGWYEDDISLTYRHKMFRNRDCTVLYSLNGNHVAMLSVTDNRPETRPRLEFPDWQAANLVGKTVDEVLDIAGAPNTYIYFIPPPGNKDSDSVFGVRTEFMEYHDAAVGSVAYNASFTLYNGRVEGAAYFGKQPMPYAEFSRYALATEKALTALLDSPVWLRRQIENTDNPEKVLQWRLNSCMADARFAIWLGGRVYADHDSSLFPVFIYDRSAQGAQAKREVADFIFGRIQSFCEDPEWQHGGDITKLPAALVPDRCYSAASLFYDCQKTGHTLN